MPTASKPKPKTEGRMKITLTTCMAGPLGVARPGTVLDMPEPQAKQMLADRMGREFDKQRDAKAPQGLTKPGKD